MGPVQVILITLLAVTGAFALMRLRAAEHGMAGLRRKLEEQRTALDSTSKLLIQKNMELFDQNVRQQREIESKQDFIGIVSHQLRTPATEVRWGLDALAAEMRAQPRSGREEEYFDKLRTSAERMVKLIDSLVRLMAVDEQYRRPLVAAYEPDAVVRSLAEELAREFGEKGIRLELALKASGTIDIMGIDAFSLVTENLLENAYEYTKPGGTVTVSTARGEDGALTVSVKDTGIGIPTDKQATLFVKYQRAEVARRMNSGGMGLGLYLVKNIVERHGGTVGFESTEGAGSTFYFRLPAKTSLA